MHRAVVVSGEASETDSEDEVQERINDLSTTNAVHGTSVAREDTESDDDSNQSVASAISALEQCENITRTSAQVSYNSLLHRKLREDNVQFHKTLEGFCNSNVNDAVNTLSGTDQQLVRSEVTLQNAATSLKTLNIGSNTLKNKLHSMLSANFLPNVKINE